MRRGERPLSMLPRLLLLGFVLLFAAQLLNHHINRREFETSYRPLTQPLDLPFYHGLAMGSEQLLGYLLAIRLQLHDNQAGQHFVYRMIDYDRLVDWLDRISDISAGTEYPMLLASRIYTQTRHRQRLALRLAQKLAAQPASVEMPRWARDFEILLLADLNEFESAIAIIEALLQSGSIKDPDEHKFLNDKLSEFQQKLFEFQQK